MTFTPNVLVKVTYNFMELMVVRAEFKRFPLVERGWNFVIHLELEIINNMNPIIEKDLCEKVKELAKAQSTKLVEIAQAIRGALCGKLVSPSVFEIIEILGQDESVRRIENFIENFS